MREAPRTRITSWSPFKRNFSAGGIIVIKLRQGGVIQATTSYRVRYACCGRIVKMTHRRILDRIRDEKTHCQVCATAIANANRAKSLQDRAKSERTQPVKVKAKASVASYIRPRPRSWDATSGGRGRRKKHWQFY